MTKTSKKFVIDTSLFVNPNVRGDFGTDTPSAVMGFLKKASRMKNVEFFMPASVIHELKNFAGGEACDELELVVRKRSPNLHAMYMPAAVFYNFVEDVRVRINKGLRLAEEFAKDNRPDNDMKLAKLRDKYRDSMRTGILDSKEDFELVLLAKELDATLVSADEGVLNFANDLGCEWINASKFGALLKKKR